MIEGLDQCQQGRRHRQLACLRIGQEPPSPIHTGQIAHKSELYPGQDPALIANETWAAVRDQRTLQFPREYGSTEQRAARGAGRG